MKSQQRVKVLKFKVKCKCPRCTKYYIREIYCEKGCEEKLFRLYCPICKNNKSAFYVDEDCDNVSSSCCISDLFSGLYEEPVMFPLKFIPPALQLKLKKTIRQLKY